MRRVVPTVLVAVAAAVALAVPASAESTQVFKAQFHDAETACPPGTDICGKGTMKGFGTVTTSLAFTGFAPGPGANCVTATAVRTATLDRDGSDLVLVLSGTICDQKLAGTFVIAGGSGVLAGASGGGSLSGVAIPGAPSDTVHFEGTITVP